MFNLIGFKTISLLILRKDRWYILTWIALVAIFTFYVAFAMPIIYPNAEDAFIIVDTLKNPAMVAMFGPYFGEDAVYNLAAIFSTEMLLMTMAAVSTMTILAVNRHTRKDEEEGRLEMIRSFPIGKSTVLLATVFVYSLVSLILGFIVGTSLFLTGLEGITFNGSMLFGANLAFAGIFFASITAVFAQLMQTSRGSLGLSFTVLGVTYLLRGFGDISGSWLRLFPPFGPLLYSSTLVENIWSLSLMILLSSILFVFLASYLNQLRDLDASFIPVRKGRSEASRFLNSPFALTVKNARTSIITWFVVMLVLGASYGSILGNIEDFFSGNPLYQQLISSIGGTGTLVERFIVMLYAVIAIIAMIPAIQIVNKIRSEEKENRVEPILARAVSKNRLLFGYILLAIITSVIMTLAGILGLYGAGSQVSNTPLDLINMILAVFVYLPATWVFISVSVLLIGFKPSFLKIVWVYLGFGFASIYFGGILQLPSWVIKLSPLGYVQKYPAEEYSLISGVGLITVTLILLLVGSTKFNNRNLDG